MTLPDYVECLTNGSESIPEIIENHIFCAEPYVRIHFPEAWKNVESSVLSFFPDKEIAEVIVTGSGLLGFSLHKFRTFDLDSDIDVAIISDHLYQDYLELARQLEMQIRANIVWLPVEHYRTYCQFLRYLTIGWVRPDKLPPTTQFRVIQQDWFRNFKNISRSKPDFGGRKVSGAVFRSKTHLKYYYEETLGKAKSNLSTREN